MSDTPRTDAAYKEALDALGGDHSFALGQMRGYAEELERELTALLARLEASEKDAARWKWVQGLWDACTDESLEAFDALMNATSRDAAIDSAMGGRDAA